MGLLITAGILVAFAFGLRDVLRSFDPKPGIDPHGCRHCGRPVTYDGYRGCWTHEYEFANVIPCGLPGGTVAEPIR